MTDEVMQARRDRAALTAYPAETRTRWEPRLVEWEPIPASKPDDRAWTSEAACRGIDPDLFFPIVGGNAESAKEVCRGCVVRQECLDYALAHNERMGIWGGTSDKERREMKRQRRRAG